MEDPLNECLMNAYSESYKKFLRYASEQLMNLHYTFDWDTDEELDELYEFLRCIMLGKLEDDMMDYDTLKAILQEECYNWYLAVLQTHKENLLDENSIDVVADSIKLIIRSFLVNHIYLDDIFERAWDLNYSELTLKYLNSSIESIIKPTILHLVRRVENYVFAATRKNAESLLLKMLQIYHTFRNLVEYMEAKIPKDVSLLSMVDYPSWFGEKMILEWFVLSTTQSAPFIQRAVECDQLESLDEFIKHGTSAPDVVNIIDEMVVIIWMKMQWEHQFYTHESLIKAINTCAVTYAEAISVRIKTAVFFSLGSEFYLSPKLCVALNNVYALFEHMHIIESKIMEVIRAAEDRFGFIFVDHANMIQYPLLEAVSNVFILVLAKIKGQLIGFTSHLKDFNEAKTSPKAMSMFCCYIEDCLEILYNYLKPCPFRIMLRAMWIIVLDVLSDKAKKSHYLFRNKPSESTKTITPLLQVLQKVFYCKGYGLSYYEMESKKYLELKGHSVKS